jgi:hypothetical protein
MRKCSFAFAFYILRDGLDHTNPRELSTSDPWVTISMMVSGVRFKSKIFKISFFGVGIGFASLGG